MTRTAEIHDPSLSLLPEAVEEPRVRRIPLVDGLTRRLSNRHVTPKQLLFLTSQLSTMTSAGCDLCAALEALARQQPQPYLRDVLMDVQDAVKSGHSFAQALARHPDVFNKLYITMVRIGESAGLMRNMLAGLQMMIRNHVRVVAAVRSALLYPCILLSVAMAAIVVLTTFVLPRFAAVFKSAHVALPLTTTMLLDGSEFIGNHAPVLLLGLVLLVAGIIFLVTRPSVRRYTHAWILRLPLLGPTLRLSYVVRSIQTLGTLIKSGLPLADTLQLIRDLMPNVYYQQFFDDLRQHISEGKPLAPDFEATSLFPPMVAQMIAVGEQTGTLANVCLEVASFHEEEMHDRIKLLTTALEPLIIILLGAGVGFIAVSIILPMFRLSSALH